MSNLFLICPYMYFDHKKEEVLNIKHFSDDIELEDIKYLDTIESIEESIMVSLLMK